MVAVMLGWSVCVPSKQTNKQKPGFTLDFTVARDLIQDVGDNIFWQSHNNKMGNGHYQWPITQYQFSDGVPESKCIAVVTRRKHKFLVLTSDLYSWHQYYWSQDASGNADDEAVEVSRLRLFAVVSSEVDKLLATLCLLTCQEYDLLAKPIWNPVGKGVWAIEVAGFLLLRARENRRRSAGWEPNIYLAQRVRGGRVRVKPTASDCAGEGIQQAVPMVCQLCHGFLFYRKPQIIPWLKEI